MNVNDTLVFLADSGLCDVFKPSQLRGVAEKVNDIMASLTQEPDARQPDLQKALLETFLWMSQNEAKMWAETLISGKA